MNFPFLRLGILIPFLYISTMVYGQDDQDTGFVSINIQKPSGVEIDSFFIAVNSNFTNPIKISLQDTIKLPVGLHKLTLFQKYYRDTDISVDIKPDSLLQHSIYIQPFRKSGFQKINSSYPLYFWKANVFILTDLDTEIIYAGKSMGSGIVKISSTKEKFMITGLTFDGSKITRRFKRKNKMQVFEMYYRPNKMFTYAFSFFPGAAQIYKREKIKGALLISAFIGTAALSGYYIKEYKKKYDQFKDIERKYLATQDPLTAFELGSRAEYLLENSRNTAKKRNYLIASLSAIYLYNVIDGFIKPKMGFRTDRISFDPYLDFDKDAFSMNIRVRKSF